MINDKLFDDEIAIKYLTKDVRKLRSILRRCVKSLERAGCPSYREPLVTAKKVLKETR